jgi:hypothetical protein
MHIDGYDIDILVQLDAAAPPAALRIAGSR